ncbi:hypothetical protein DRQ09_08725 [candidate division KSB1 bacterium]|nr:MAG: hypothetical protein DRQ09_08725 [candidate division KSB1 bacterium]
MGTKKDVISELFKRCKKSNNFVFNNELVKQVCKEYNFGNPFDATKLDNTSKFPQVLTNEDYFIIHLGQGNHKFVKGIDKGFHYFEKIDKNNIFDWKYQRSILNEFDTSESNILSVANNQRIIHDYLYEDIIASPKVYNARRTKISFSYFIGNENIQTKNLQMEIDLTMELNGIITVFEGKNGFPKDFAVYQLFHPFKYFRMLKDEKELDIKQITCCYVLRKKQKNTSILRLYNYTFNVENDLGSIKLLKNAQYNLIKR